MITLSSTTHLVSVNLFWYYTNNDTRVRVMPTTNTTDDSIGIIYTTVIQFDYLIEQDEGNYTCTSTIDGNSAESTFSLEIISKYQSFNSNVFKIINQPIGQHNKILCLKHNMYIKDATYNMFLT